MRGMRGSTTAMTLAIICSALGPSSEAKNTIGSIESYGAIYLTNDDGKDKFGASMAVLHDMDNDGILDAAIGAPSYTPGGKNALKKVGMLFVFNLKPNGAFKEPYNAIEGSKVGLGRAGKFGRSVTSVNDVDGNGHFDLVVGAEKGLYLVFLQGIQDEGFKYISPEDLGAVGDAHDFGASVSGTSLFNHTEPAFDFVAGNPYGDGEVVFVKVDASGAVEETWGVGAGDVGLSGENSEFGSAVALLPDLDGNGALELLVGAPGFGADDGLVVLLMMSTDYRSVERSFNATLQDLAGKVTPRSRFGSSVAFMSAVNSTMFQVAVGAPDDSTIRRESGAAVILSLSISGHVVQSAVINDLRPYRARTSAIVDPEKNAHFGASVAGVRDLNRNGAEDLFVGVPDLGCCGYAAELFLGPEAVYWDDAFYPTPPPTEAPSLSGGILTLVSYMFTICMLCSCGYCMLSRCRETMGAQQHGEAETVEHASGQRVNQTILNQLPVIKYSLLTQDLLSQDGGLNKTGNGTLGSNSHPELHKGDIETCCICLCDYESEDSVRQLPCQHFFHRDCIDEYLNTAFTCPLCRQDVVTAVRLDETPRLAANRISRQGSLRTHPTLLAGFYPIRRMGRVTQPTDAQSSQATRNDNSRTQHGTEEPEVANRGGSPGLRSEPRVIELVQSGRLPFSRADTPLPGR